MGLSMKSFQYGSVEQQEPARTLITNHRNGGHEAIPGFMGNLERIGPYRHPQRGVEVGSEMLLFGHRLRLAKVGGADGKSR